MLGARVLIAGFFQVAITHGRSIRWLDARTYSMLELRELLSQVGLRRDYASVSEPNLVGGSGD
jgi:hypothetical protein